MPFSGQIRTKRIDAEYAPDDGIRVLVSRLPQGALGQNYKLDACLSELAPSAELMNWLRNRPEPWLAFRMRYLKELRRSEAAMALSQLYQLASCGNGVTLLFSGEDERHNNATALKELLDGLRKPPTGSGPLRPVRMRQTKTLRG